MIELTDEQIRVLQSSGEMSAAVVNPRTHESYVLVRREVYERVRALVDEDFSSEDAFRAQIESAAAAGWDDPALDVYNDMEFEKR